MGNSSLAGLSGGRLDGDVGAVYISSADAAFPGSTAEGSPTSAVTSSPLRASNMLARVRGGLPTEGGDVATSTRRSSSADSSDFLFLQN